MSSHPGPKLKEELLFGKCLLCGHGKITKVGESLWCLIKLPYGTKHFISFPCPVTQDYDQFYKWPGEVLCPHRKALSAMRQWIAAHITSLKKGENL
jgi:hypothetical protein